MENHAAWNPQSDQTLRHLYEVKKVFNWAAIADELTQKFNQNFTRDGCRNRLRLKYMIIREKAAQEEWSYEEEQELYRLHNQNGNKWAIIAYNLLGRTDNSVKNHFHSKLRKSLRTLNKIGKNYLRKSVQQVNTTVLYKLTEATDQALKQNPQITQELINLCYDLKARLLNYDLDQKDIKQGFDYSFQQNLLTDLNNFNRNYRKKPKKEKNSAMGTENLKRLHERKRKERQFKLVSQNMYQYERKYLAEGKEEEENHLNQESNRASQSSSVFPKITKTVVLKAPSFSFNQDSSEKFPQLISPLFPKEIKRVAKRNADIASQNPNLVEIENVLRDQGVLESQQEENANDFFRRERSYSSASSGHSFSSVRSHSDFDFFNDSRDRLKDFDSMSDNHEMGLSSNSLQN